MLGWHQSSIQVCRLGLRFGQPQKLRFGSDQGGPFVSDTKNARTPGPKNTSLSTKSKRNRATKIQRTSETTFKRNPQPNLNSTAGAELKWKLCQYAPQGVRQSAASCPKGPVCGKVARVRLGCATIADLIFGDLCQWNGIWSTGGCQNCALAQDGKL